jgi:hypothetical protein
VTGPAGRRPPTWLPWALCWFSTGLLLIGAGLRIAHPEGVVDGIFSVAASTLSIALVPLVGALLAARLPANPYGWLWCVGGLTFGVVAVCDGLRRTGAVPDWLPGALSSIAYLAGVCTLVFILLLFPTGRLPSPPWRWPARTAVLVAAVGVLVVPFASSTLDEAPPTPWAVPGQVGDVLRGVLQGSITALFLLLLPAAASVVMRFRRAGPVERQQLKWFLLAGVLAAVSTGVTVPGGPTTSPAWVIADGISTGLLPAAVGIAVLRYRLYEIDRIISRTVSYGLLTGGLVALYFGVVTVLRPLLEPVTGSSALAVAGSTLAVAAVFNPARGRLQAVVDRRFDRARYDAGRAVDAFATRLRDQVDLGHVVGGLRDTVSATVAPTRIAIWLRSPSGTGKV